MLRAKPKQHSQQVALPRCRSPIHRAIAHCFNLRRNGKTIARDVAGLIKAVNACARVHFRTAEQMMKRYGFGGIQRQEDLHHVEAKIHAFYEELHDNPLVARFDVLSYLRDGLIQHIRVADAGLRILVGSSAPA